MDFISPESLIALGYIGLFIAGFLAGTVIPFSSEVVLIALVYSGMDPYLLLLWASVGNIAGGFVTYEMGRAGNLDRIRSFFRISEDKLKTWSDAARKKGSILAILAWVPIIGNAIQLSLGLLHVHRWLVVSWMSIGKVARYAVLIWLTVAVN